MAKQKKIDLEHMTEKEKMKYEIADELGLLDRVLNDGWRSLTAKETGRIGGLVTRRKRQAAEGQKERESLQFNRIKQVLYFNCEKQSVVGWDLLVSGVIQAF